MFNQNLTEYEYNIIQTHSLIHFMSLYEYVPFCYKIKTKKKQLTFNKQTNVDKNAEFV